jgi:hypothetical protein
MKNILLILSIILCGIVTGQNLVPNPSFENYASCPTNLSQFTLAIPWVMPQNTSPASSDLYNGCNATIVNVPSNVCGYQTAHTGIGYAGIFTYGASNLREYMQVQLSSPLLAGNIYTVEMYANPSKNAGIGVDAIGIYISTDSAFGTGTVNPLPYAPQISNPTGNIISDTIAWTLVSGFYTALGGEKYITIGNFLDDLSTNSFVFNPTGWGRGYYLIDDVSVALSSPTAINEIDDADLNISPNPFSRQTTFHTSKFLNNATLTIYNSMGQQVKQISNIVGRTVLLQRDNLIAGVYSICLTQDNAKTLTERIVIID